jgi:hypothetical protein
MPTSVRVAVITMGLLAALLLVNAGLLWYAFDATVERVIDASKGITEADARQFVLLALIPYLVIGLILALAAWFLPRRQPWSRWLGLAASVLLGLLTLFSLQGRSFDDPLPHTLVGVVGAAGLLLFCSMLVFAANVFRSLQGQAAQALK